MNAHIIDPEGLALQFVEGWHNDRPYVVAHTSGSTGTPKEIHLLKSDMIASARATCLHFGINTESTLHLPLSTDYIAGKMMVVRALVSGATLIVERPSSSPMATLPSGIETVDLTAVVPSQVPGLLASPHISKLSAVIIGGGALTADMEVAVKSSGIGAWATYGMTETCSHVALRNISAGEASFRALPGVAFSTDDRGCLVIECPDRSFGRLVTNDMVRLEAPDRFVWLGRYDNVINSGGIKLHPEEIERRLEGVVTLPYYIIGRPSARWGEEAVLVVEGATADECADILAKVRGILTGPISPKAVLSKERFIYTSSGKIKRLLP